MESQKQQEEVKEKKKKSLIAIPSYEEVIQSSQPNPKPQSFFTPSPSFSQAFSFIKDTEFYSPPPPPPPASTSQTTPSTPNTPSTSSRQISQQEVSPSSLPSGASVQIGNAILVSHRQKGNPLLKHIRNVKWNFADVVCDYMLGKTSCALYLSIRYHLLHPDYLYFRIRELPKNFKLRVVLCHVDVEDVVKPLLEVTRTAILHDCTLLCAWSLEECGRYLETIKVYENKPADILQGQMDSDYLSRLNHALTTVRHVNKTDVVTLGSTFGSLSGIMDASMEDLARCPGIGERKVKRLYETFHEPFRRIIPSKPAPVPEAPSEENSEVRALSDEMQVEKSGDATVSEDATKEKKEPSLTVKSALTAALSKYSDKIQKKKPLGKKADETNASSSRVQEEKS